MVHVHGMVDTYTDSRYGILIAFPLRQLLHERASMLRYTCTYVAYLVAPAVSLGMSRVAVDR
jgi:hypothetical protein